ncbi:MAG: hypothetical protein AVDCRST_MAG12-2915, partial [uncultured Rubrobacteraceae bacterium]
DRGAVRAGHGLRNGERQGRDLRPRGHARGLCRRGLFAQAPALRVGRAGPRRVVEFPRPGNWSGARRGKDLLGGDRWSLRGRHDLYRRGPRPTREGLETGDHVDGRQGGGPGGSGPEDRRPRAQVQRLRRGLRGMDAQQG